MQYLNRNIDRVLTGNEVHLMLLEEALAEDADISKSIARWYSLLEKVKFPKKEDSDWIGKTRVKAWKEEQTYIFKDIYDDSQASTRYFTGECHDVYFNQCWLATIPGKKQLEGLSLAEIEDVSDKFYLAGNPIKILLDSGFQLNLVVYEEFLNKLRQAE